MSNRKHIKVFQSDHYKVATKRIKNLIAFAWLAYYLPDINMKFDYETNLEFTDRILNNIDKEARNIVYGITPLSPKYPQ